MGIGAAEGFTILRDRFPTLDGHVIAGDHKKEFRFGINFDRHNSENGLTLMDTAGAYSVLARGKRDRNSQPERREDRVVSCCLDLVLLKSFALLC